MRIIAGACIYLVGVVASIYLGFWGLFIGGAYAAKEATTVSKVMWPMVRVGAACPVGIVIYLTCFLVAKTIATESD